MCTKLKLYLGRKVLDSLHKSTKISATELHPLIQIANSAPNDKIELNLPVNILENYVGLTSVNEILKIQPDDIIKNIHLIRDKISFEIDKNIFMKDVIENCAHANLCTKSKNIVVEYSSPNIAKPFHYGHLRSTIIGNFIANLNNFFKNKVTKLNYIGNWGTQYGFIKVGVDSLKYSLEDIEKNPLKLLFQSYIYANNLAIKDPKISEKAKEVFASLENGSEDELKYWRAFMNYSKSEFKNTYKRLGVEFDDYHYESDYSSKDIKEILDILRTKNIVQRDKDGKEAAQIGDRQVTVVKSDGSSLYLTRDIAAAIDRYKRYNFDKMYYVVDNTQNDHFHALKNILYKMDFPWSDRIAHVKFGRVRGLSTRKGNAVFLKDILDECKELMMKKQINSATTKASIKDDHITDILGISCVIINDLKRRRQKDYDFDWDQILQVQGDTGVKLQYTHCRLYNLEKNSGALPATECQPDLLFDTNAIVLLKEMAKFHDVLYKTNEQLESCILVKYLFDLCNQINKAFKTLQVKGMPEEIASQRLLLFKTARQVLKNGMIILGLQPLTKM